MNNAVHVNCVFGPDHLDHIREVLIPSVSSSTKRPVIFNCMCYSGEKHLTLRQPKRRSKNITVVTHENTTGKNLGFAEAHNILFQQAEPKDFFVIINPDCIAQSGSIDALIDRFIESDDIGIVEGRQWPFEHPKEFDPVSFETPWASGGYSLISAPAYQKVGGMEEAYFLYLEDVDLSWRLSLEGYKIIYEQNAPVIHFSGGRFYRSDLVENENYYSIRNIVLLMWKFFGIVGKNRAISMLAAFPDQEIVEVALEDIERNFSFPSRSPFSVDRCPSIKVLGISQFHEFRI